MGLLGSLSVERDGRPVVLGSPSQRRLLAMLAVHCHGVVSADRLADVVWGGEPPVSAAAGLQTYVSRLRSTLGAEAIRTQPPGYVLDLTDDAFDASRFERLVADAVETSSAEHVLECSALADGLWRGPPLAEFADEEWARPMAVRWSELRLVLAERRVGALLQMGRVGEAVADAEALCADQPLREGAHGWWMRALAREGRITEALRVYDRYRKHLIDEVGLEPSPVLKALEHSILSGDTIPVISALTSEAKPGKAVGRLPVEVTTFVGREREVAAAVYLVEAVSLVTLVGPGGVGKTRIGLQVARRVSPAFSGGAWFVNLAEVTDPALVATSIVSQLGVRSGLAPLEALVSALRGETRFVVLDNCEHVLPQTAEVAATILKECPGVRILATSREPLAIAGERVHTVVPMGDDGVTLFLERAAEARGSAVFDDAQFAAAREIVKRLDGLPLALELAAARCAYLEPAEIVKLSGGGLPLLGSGPRDAPDRHHTMRATIDWSWSLLTESEQLVLMRVTAFVGGFTLKAAREVCARGAIGGDLVVELVGSLVRKSQVVAQRTVDGTRFRLLDVIREYAIERLDESSIESSESVGRRHAAWAAGVLVDITRLLLSPDEATGARIRDVEAANMRAGDAWAIDHRDLDLCMQFARSMAQPTAYGLLFPVRFRRGTTVLDIPGARDHRDVAYLGAVIAARESGGSAEAASAAADLADVDGAPLRARVLALINAASVIRSQGDAPRGRAMVVRARRLAEASDDVYVQAVAAMIWVEHVLGTPDERPAVARALAAAARSGIPSALGRAHWVDAVSLLRGGDRQGARDAASKGHALAVATANEFHLALMAQMVTPLGESVSGRLRRQADMLLAGRAGGPRYAVWGVTLAAATLAKRDRGQDAAYLGGASLHLASGYDDQSIRTAMGKPALRHAIEQYPEQVEQGRRLTLDEAVEMAHQRLRRLADELDTSTAPTR